MTFAIGIFIPYGVRASFCFCYQDMGIALEWEGKGKVGPCSYNSNLQAIFWINLTYKLFHSLTTLNIAISSFEKLSVVVNKFQISEEDDMINFSEGENIIDWLWVKKAKTILVQHKLTIFYPYHKLLEHCVVLLSLQLFY